MYSEPLVTSPITIFFIVLAIIVLAPVILNRLRIPHIVGMIIAGVAVGPHGLNILANDSSFIIFGEVGLLYLMFLAGLEIDMYHLKLNFRKGLLFGIMTFSIPMALGIIVSYYLLNLGLLTSFLLGAMYAAHTLISYPVAARYGVTKSRSVLIAVVGTIFAVGGALLVLAVINDIAVRDLFEWWQFIWLLIKISVYVTLVYLLYPATTRLFLKTHSDRVTQYVFILALVFLSAWVADLIGLSGVLGAFLAGLVLNRYVPPTSPLMSRIEFVGNSIFIPYFLISVGLMVNLRLLANRDTILTAVIMIAVAIISKWIAARVSRAIYRMSAPEGNMMLGLTTAHTAVALAVVTIGYNTFLADGSRMLDESILNATIFVILVTCALAPIITSNAASKLRLEMLHAEGQQETETSSENSGQLREKNNLLIPVANPVTAPGLMELALLLSGQKKNRNVTTYLLHVRNDNGKKSRTIGDTSLELATKVASTVDVGVIPVHRFDINTVTGIINFVKERDITSIVMGMHRKSTVVDSFLGSKIEQLLEGTRQMVVIARCYAPINTLRRIVVYAPEKAHLEAGFRQWVTTVCNLAEELGCRAVFYSSPQGSREIEDVITTGKQRIRHTVNSLGDRGDFVLLAGEIADDDLFIWIASRPNTVSHDKEQGEMPSFIGGHLQRNNLLVIYPAISDQSMRHPSFATPFA